MQPLFDSPPKIHLCRTLLIRSTSASRIISAPTPSLNFFFEGWRLLPTDRFLKAGDRYLGDQTLYGRIPRPQQTQAEIGACSPEFISGATSPISWNYALEGGIDKSLVGLCKETALSSEAKQKNGNKCPAWYFRLSPRVGGLEGFDWRDIQLVGKKISTWGLGCQGINCGFGVFHGSGTGI